jgi:hypothetical protein
MDNTEQKAKLELDKLQAEIDNLQLQNRELKKSSTRFIFTGIITTITGVLTPVLVAIFGIFVNNNVSTIVQNLKDIQKKDSSLHVRNFRPSSMSDPNFASFKLSQDSLPISTVGTTGLPRKLGSKEPK